MEFFKNWVVQIVNIAILAVILEILIPSSSLKKYAKVAIGLVIMAVILNPILGFLKTAPSIEAQVFKSDYLLKNSAFEGLSEKAKEQTKILIAKEYKNRLSQQIREKLESLYNLKGVEVEIFMVEDLDKKEFGKINSLILHVKGERNFNKEEVKKLISAFYNVPLKNITIKEE
ncbi:stage III sporulation protein AF [Caldanaerobacter subterraneus subsp. yonseiensis KB-1]|uniref:Stage III sporulation protein AF n=2 Tax=Caldanaerobacter subterraneus TaxID=911092 RepID=U5CNW1_CALSX|nr:stage III sporulation protein AF [Caldanaerobacter subterraneus]ERM91688.1 stage III sporulation protein AF [Caldanaerobacter subterraneus subsp. yonseiensis KB-1]KKC29768.1 stage III sporulation protein AF [Caldanaerobacter subterraneus subsp. pacificus DSM 12653]